MDFNSQTLMKSVGGLGVVDKAVIKVIGGTAYTQHKQNQLVAKDGNTDDDEETEGIKLAGPNVSSVKIGQSGKATSIKSITEDAAWGVSSDDMIEKAKVLGQLESSVRNAFNQYGKTFTVPFNPASFTLSGNAGGQVENTDFSRTDGKKGDAATVNFQPAPLTIRMDVELIFNDVDNNDAFIETSGTDSIKGAAKGIGKMLGATATHSIRREVEGLIAATRSFTTCLISFNWGHMTYYGELERLEANYKMFNPQGEPIAGSVHLTILLIDEGVNEKSMGKWFQAYVEAFSKRGSHSMASSGQSVGNSSLLNFTL